MEFKVFTLNCWGIPYVAKHRAKRMQHIAEYLSLSEYDAVCLQEVWTSEDFELIRSSTANILPYSHYFYSGVFGSGICILSKYPIIDVFYHQWPLNGYIHKLHHGDWFAGKGVGLCRVKVKNFNINLYTAHLHAEYNRQNDEYIAHRILQAFDTAQFIHLTSQGADAAILAGDLNAEPNDLAYKLIVGVPHFKDAFIESGESTPYKFATNESLKGSYTSSYNIRNKIPGKRIDYIMYTCGDKIDIKLKKYDLPLPDRVPKENFSYSDHEAIAATFYLNSNENLFNKENCEIERSALDESIIVMNEALTNLKNHQFMYWIFVLLLLIVGIVLISFESTFLSNTSFIIFTTLKVCIALSFLYSIIMATFWNRIEKHSIIAAKLAMEMRLKKLQNASK